jgi:hypothetical protein
MTILHDAPAHSGMWPDGEPATVRAEADTPRPLMTLRGNLCSQHRLPLDGGPVLFRCPKDDGHRVMAADVNHEYHGEAS